MATPIWLTMGSNAAMTLFFPTRATCVCFSESLITTRTELMRSTTHRFVAKRRLDWSTHGEGKSRDEDGRSLRASESDSEFQISRDEDGRTLQYTSDRCLLTRA